MDANNYQSQVRLSGRLDAKRKAQQEAKPISERIDDMGKLKVWLLREKRYAEFWPVDAMVLLKRGDAQLDEPQTESETNVDPRVAPDPKTPDEPVKPPKPTRAIKTGK